jgi:hypothetical protein
MSARFTFTLIEEFHDRRHYKMLVETRADESHSWKPATHLAEHYVRFYARSFGHWNDTSSFLLFFKETGPGTYEWVVEG